jgi:hypothetical protein
MNIIIGQEAICPDGLGRVESFRVGVRDSFIQVNPYVGKRSGDGKWIPKFVELIDPRGIVHIPLNNQSSITDIPLRD